MSKAKFSRDEAVKAIAAFDEATYQEYRNYAFSAGALGSMLADALVMLPAAERKILLATLTSMTAKYTK
jgi:hypothetical protein